MTRGRLRCLEFWSRLTRTMSTFRPSCGSKRTKSERTDRMHDCDRQLASHLPGFVGLQATRQPGFIKPRSEHHQDRLALSCFAEHPSPRHRTLINAGASEHSVAEENRGAEMTAVPVVDEPRRGDLRPVRPGSYGGRLRGLRASSGLRRPVGYLVGRLGVRRGTCAKPVGAGTPLVCCPSLAHRAALDRDRRSHGERRPRCRL
jgi:hypothetical protein